MCNMEFVHKVSRNIHSCCAKVNTRNKRTGIDMIGFVVREENNNWLIHLADNTTVCLPRGTYNQESKTYIFPDTSTCSRKITQLWPVRVWVFKSGDIKITLKSLLCR